MTPQARTDWSKVAAWTFGVWAVMVPLSAGIVSHYERQTVENQEAIRKEIYSLRLEVAQQHALYTEQLAKLDARQQDVLRRLAIVEGEEHELNDRTSTRRAP